MEKIRADVRQIYLTEQELAAQIRIMSERIEDMEASLSKLNAMWSGPANSAFSKKAREEADKLRDICAKFKEIFGFEYNAEQSYAQCSRNVQEIVDSFIQGQNR